LTALTTMSAVPPWQQALRAKCVHPSGTFIEFDELEIQQSIPDRFEKIVEKFPDRCALKNGDYKLTYKQLNNAANQIAEKIVSFHGVVNNPVAILLEPGVQAITAILAVLKSGKTCVPLDADFPHERNRSILEDSHAALCLTNNRQLSEATALGEGDLDIINLDDLESDSESPNLCLPIVPDSSSYIIYTSGATGEPKGVVQNHRNILHKALAFTNSIHICAEDRAVLLYSHSASGSIRDIFSALLSGASLYPYSVKQSGLTELRNLLIEEEITIYNSVATLFRHLANCFDGHDKPAKLRVINLGSETIYNTDVELFKTHFPQNCIFVARLGSTELSPIREFFVDIETEITSDTVPAGYPVTGAEICLHDEHGNDVGYGCIGEIVVRSQFLPCEYWRKPILTEKKFLSETGGSPERFFRTGDLGKLQPDGCLLHLGRKDFQVKIRGHRVEVTEIEFALMKLPAVKEAVIKVVVDGLGEQRLVAYVVPVDGKKLDVGVLRSALSNDFPTYMMPRS